MLKEHLLLFIIFLWKKQHLFEIELFCEILLLDRLQSFEQ